MISDEGEPVLMDFGSAIKARIRVDTRQQALTQQDIAAEQSTMPYRAPELFDVKTGTTLDEKVDIWVRISSPSYIFLISRAGSDYCLFFGDPSRWGAHCTRYYITIRRLRVRTKAGRLPWPY